MMIRYDVMLLLSVHHIYLPLSLLVVCRQLWRRLPAVQVCASSGAAAGGYRARIQPAGPREAVQSAPCPTCLVSKMKQAVVFYSHISLYPVVCGGSLYFKNFVVRGGNIYLLCFVVLCGAAGLPACLLTEGCH